MNDTDERPMIDLHQLFRGPELELTRVHILLLSWAIVGETRDFRFCYNSVRNANYDAALIRSKPYRGSSRTCNQTLDPFPPEALPGGPLYSPNCV